MRNYKMIICYDGTRYNGWQRQNTTDMTIQGIVEQGLSKCIGYQVEIDASGRTDAGVHALGQVANVKVAGKLDEEKLKQDMNEQLPEDIQVKHVELVKNGFHSRLDAIGKRYVYTIDTKDKASVFRRKYAYHFTKGMDLNAMNKAVKYLVGTKDFACFSDKKEDKSTVRTLYDVKITQEGEQLKLAYHGSGFLYHMVRIMTGILIQVGTHELDAEEIPAMIQSKSRGLKGFLAPAQGLCLEEVFYKLRQK